MANYKKFSWKKNIRLVPQPIQMKLKSLPKKNLAVLGLKKVTAADIENGTFDHLGIKVRGGEIVFPAAVTPPPDTGLYSNRNINGWEVKRTDLPKINKTIHLGERPNYGDWSKGSFSLWQTRAVYQVDEFAPRDFQIRISAVKAQNDSATLKFEVSCTLDQADADFDEDLLFCLNLLQENTGLCDVDRAEKTLEEYAASLIVDWEIFPPGSVDAFYAKVSGKIGKVSPETTAVINERVQEFRKLSPQLYIFGTGGFNKYIGAKLSDNVVVFENIRYGNALYVLYENWETVSKRSRIDLMHGTSAEYERIPHAEGWAEHFRAAVRRARPQR